MSATIGKRLERMLIKLAEDDGLTKVQRLKAAIELSHLRRLVPMPTLPQTASNTVLGSKASER